MLRNSPSMFCFRGFIVSQLSIKSLIYFNFCVCYKNEVQFHYFSCGYLVFPTQFIEETVLYPLHIPVSTVAN